MIFLPSDYAFVRLAATLGLGTGVYFVFQTARLWKRFVADATKAAALYGIKAPRITPPEIKPTAIETTRAAQAEALSSLTARHSEKSPG